MVEGLPKVDCGHSAGAGQWRSPAISGYSAAAASGSSDSSGIRRIREGPADGALPELRRPADCHCGHPGAAGDREDPHAPGIAGTRTASGSGPWPGAASGLRLPNRDRSDNPATRAAGVGGVRAFAGSVEVPCGPGMTRKRRPRRTIFGGGVNAQQTAAASEDRFKRTKRRARSCSVVFGVPWEGKMR